jgi:hypothetical protein
MSTRFHYRLRTVCEIGGFALVLVVALTILGVHFYRRAQGGDPTFGSNDLPLVALPLFGSALTSMLAHILFCDWIPARCPRCSGPCYCSRKDPTRYTCVRCRANHVIQD